MPDGTGPTTIPAMHTQRIPVADGVELAVDVWAPSDDPPGETSARPPFVLVHGLASNARMWDGVAQTLATAGHAAVAVDLRGHGRSSKPAGPYDVPTVADDLVALVERLAHEQPELERPVLVGQSWGGNVVLEMAARHPAATRGIVCVDGGWLEPSRRFADWNACLAALAPPRLVGRQLAEVEGYVRSAHPDWPELGIRGVLANFEVRPDGTVAPWLTYQRHIEVLHGLWGHHPSERYAGLAVPALLVPADGGDVDGTQRKRDEVEAAAATIPSARVRWFVGDHDVHAQHPRELAGVMHDMTADGFLT